MRSILLAAVVAAAFPTLAHAQDQDPHRASLAVTTFGYEASVLETQDGVTRAYLQQFETSSLSTKLVTALSQTRRFDILDRNQLDKALAEQQLGESGLMDPSRAVKAGKLVGADYFVSGQISFFTASETVRELPFVNGWWTHECTLKVVVDLRVVDPRTTRVVAAERGEASRTTKFQATTTAFSSVSAELLDSIQRDLAAGLAQKVVDGIYPIKVVSSGDGFVYLNRGEGSIAVGEVLDVFKVGEELVDPDTRARLGSVDTKLGEVRVVSVEAKVSKAIPEGRTILGDLARGTLCRRHGAPNTAPVVTTVPGAPGATPATPATPVTPPPPSSQTPREAGRGPREWW